MKLSAALIVKNESSEIEACLDSLIGVDEIVVVDTGSVDDTESIVDGWAMRHRRIEVVLCRFEWSDSFSEARNFAASKCSGDWIFHFDADMRVRSGDVKKLKPALRKVKGRTAAIWQESAPPSGGVRNRRVMFHRPGVKWKGAIHEAMEFDDKETLNDVTFFYGWSKSHLYDPERNLRILRSEAKNNPSPRIFYYLGSELYTAGLMTEALGWFIRCAETSTWRAERGDAWLFVAKIRWNNEQGNEARDAALKSLINTPDCKEALELLAAMSFPEEAAHWLKFASVATNSGVIFARSRVLQATPLPTTKEVPSRAPAKKKPSSKAANRKSRCRT